MLLDFPFISFSLVHCSSFNFALEGVGATCCYKTLLLSNRKTLEDLKRQRIFLLLLATIEVILFYFSLSFLLQVYISKVEAPSKVFCLDRFVVVLSLI
jgi:hypothetical protein